MDAWVLEMQRYAFLLLLTEIVVLAVFLYVLYLLTKAAVRDGINESRLGKRLGKQRTLYERSKDIKF
jgi:hypothetical protein